MLKRTVIRKVRIAASAALGAVCSCVMLTDFISTVWQQWIIIYILCPVLMCRMAYRSKGLRKTVSSVIYFYLAGVMLSGIRLLLEYSLYYAGIVLPFVMKAAVMAASSGVAVMMWRGLQNTITEKNSRCRVEIFFGDRHICTEGLIDTGNSLRTFTGKPVSILSEETWKKMLTESETEAVYSYIEVLKGNADFQEMEKIRLFPVCFSTVSSENEIMAALIIDKIIVAVNEKDMIYQNQAAALSTRSFGFSEGFGIILNCKI